MEPVFDDTKLFSYTDAEITDFIISLSHQPGSLKILPLSSNLLAKGYREEKVKDAVRSVEFASQVGIPVPRIHRSVKIDNTVYCIMDRIPGKTLDMVWPELGWIASLRLAFQLPHLIHRLRSVTSTFSGSLATGKCRPYFLQDSFGLPPRATSDQVNAFLNFWANFVSICQEITKTAAEHATCSRPVFLHDGPFVFTHHDLAPRNMIVDPEGQLWLIYWDFAGFYPQYFEYAGMFNFIPTAWDKFTTWRWDLFAWIAGGVLPQGIPVAGIDKIQIHPLPACTQI